MAGSVPEDALPTPNTFAFPFQPYDIQVDFMKALYRGLEDKSCGILESPTGTVGMRIDCTVPEDLCLYCL